MPADSVLTVVDCGAHIGLSALYLAHRYPKARVIAIEPNPTNFALLRENTKGEPRITTLRGCVSDKSGQTFISIIGYGSLHTIGSIGVPVNAFTLPDICARFEIETIDFLKMDIEGTEKRIFAAGVENARAIAVELHGDYTIDLFAKDVAPLRVFQRDGIDPVIAV